MGGKTTWSTNKLINALQLGSEMETPEEWIIIAISIVFKTRGVLHVHLNKDASHRSIDLSINLEEKL